ncbi:hypothetical protein SI859A1_00172 [Aurantimonas manganoxydans SI85-9A1]|uniref:Uncharacterized protein n=1 Tax=Aurantimonas manganoxydans (strain ATCC BAA-1229 / DSM 21871 / SI85-9A1) TaxID=287752 RepID=Q1YHQ8_AURMS|nr:hypothetical protein SI859A1_00172 [Aurantimonas manganoxydans SI85-9A1]
MPVVRPPPSLPPHLVCNIAQREVNGLYRRQVMHETSMRRLLLAYNGVGATAIGRGMACLGCSCPSKDRIWTVFACHAVCHFGVERRLRRRERREPCYAGWQMHGPDPGKRAFTDGAEPRERGAGGQTATERR